MKNITSFFLAFSLVFLVSCKIKNQETSLLSARPFNKVYGGSGDDYATSIVKSGDGGYIIAGSTNSHDGDLAASVKYKNMATWILKLDSNGNILWQKTLGGSVSNYASPVAATPDGAFVTLCNTYKKDGKLTDDNGNNVLVVKFNVDGIIMWQKTLPGSSNDYGYSIAITSEGGYLIAGSTGSNDAEVVMVGKQEGTRAWLTKLDASGNLIWQRSPGSGSDIRGIPVSITATTNGGFVLAGNTYTDNHGKVNGPHGVQDAWVAKLDSSGNILWQKILGGSSSDYANSITTTTDGSYVMAGYTSSNDGDVTGNHGLQDAWIVKLDDDGKILWQKTLGAEKSDYANFNVKTADGGCIMAGRTIIKDGILTGNGDDDAWLVKMDGNGNLVWQETIGGSGIDDARSVVENGNGYFMAGLSNSLNGDVRGNHGSYDAWLVAVRKP